MRIAPEVAEALAGARPVVALESTLISHGLPRPRNLGVAHEVEATVRAGAAVPGATTAAGSPQPVRSRSTRAGVQLCRVMTFLPRRGSAPRRRNGGT